MAVQIDWSILRPVDFGRELQQGIETGRQMAQRAAVEGALRDLTPEFTGVINENPNADPELAARRRKAEGVLAVYAPDRYAALSRIRAARQQEQRNLAIGQAYGRDPREAQRLAIEGGDFELAKTLQGLQPDQFKAVKARTEAAAPIAYQAMKLPYEQRKAFIDSNAQFLAAAGFSPDELAAFDPTDQALGNIITAASTVQQLQERDTVRYVPVNEGARLVPFDQFGRPLADDTGGAQSSPPPAAPPSSPPVGGGGALSFVTPPGVTVTSDYRDPAHNARVGGVANSFHTQRGPDGQPLARDIVPGRSGMSMGALADYTRAKNPGMDVINEGDHVHLEPSPATAARLRQRGTAKPKEGRVDTDKIRADAQAAIAAGADARKVRERAAELGVVL